MRGRQDDGSATVELGLLLATLAATVIGAVSITGESLQHLFAAAQAAITAVL
jgi:Flp pilus assembly pilin Flp